MNLISVDAIIFDCDGVLVDSEIIHIAAERQLLAEMGLEYELADYIRRFVGLSGSDFYKELSHDYAAQSLGTFPDDFADRLHTRVWPRIESELQAISGVENLVKGFHGPVCVASSASVPKLIAKLRITRLLDLFGSNVFSSDHVKRGKPSPDLFLHASKAMNVAPSNCLVIEDSINGVLAAKSAGMHCIGFLGGAHVDETHRSRLQNAGADGVARTHAEIAALLNA